ncbi:insecticidal delta-endotoxin Cry8Ea1 family protein [Bacillus thuringiensis]|uniref:insecticidal delta-endotoxin Cry8Ea1 family protein n=1 Tax=Bacillus thuringiensis TaxID=1428 RepID=UPI000211E272|nr:insecticidal delta-endotoxin Cry8Ea1 family protein [Bacillus thuringiensis]ARX70195.1 hypothetical protein BVH75_30100 [Bacillus thuringiensis]MEB9697506.1 insecticidal delta-endotoxin Cry8Ea1 family protein [Bacillus cereus]
MVNENMDMYNNNGSMNGNPDMYNKNGSMNGNTDVYNNNGSMNGNPDMYNNNGSMNGNTDVYNNNGSMNGNPDVYNKNGSMDGNPDMYNNNGSMNGNTDVYNKNGSMNGNPDMYNNNGSMNGNTDVYNNNGSMNGNTDNQVPAYNILSAENPSNILESDTRCTLNVKNVQDEAICTGSNLTNEIGPLVVPIAFTPIILTPALIEVGKWLGVQIGKWALSTALKELKSFLFPNSDPQREMEKLRIELENSFNKKLTEDKLNFLTAAYTGFNNLSNSFISATERVKAAEITLATAPSQENQDILDEARTLARDYFVSLHSQMIVWLPQFEISGYEEISLPLFTQMCTLHLTHLKDGVLMGQNWGLSTDDIKHFKGEFYRLSNDYTSRAFDSFHRGFNRLRTQQGTAGVIKFRTAMNAYAFDNIYKWSLLRYEGINPRITRSLWHYIGYNSSLGSNDFNTLYKLMVGIPHERFRTVAIGYRAKTGEDWKVTGAKSTFYSGGGEWVGNVSKATRIPVYTTKTDWRQFERRIHGRLGTEQYTRWHLTIQDTNIIGNSYLTGLPFDISYPDYFIRTISAKPEAYPIYKSLSLGDNPGYVVDNPGNNLIIGFSPDNLKTFMTDGNRYHSIESGYPTNPSCTIPAVLYNSVSNPFQAYFNDELGNGSDGSITLIRRGGAHYLVDSRSASYDRSFRLIIRIQAGSSAFKVTVRSRHTSESFELNFTLLSDQDINYYYDYISQPFNLSSTYYYIDVERVVSDDIRALTFNQMIIVPTTEFQIL